MLELGTKYEITHLRHDAIVILAKMFPPHLYQFDQIYPSDRRLLANDSTFLDKDLPSILTVARKFGLTFLLPALYLRVWMTTTLEDIWGAGLGLSELRDVVMARSRIIDRVSWMVKSWLPLDTDHCDGGTRCLWERHKVFEGEVLFDTGSRLRGILLEKGELESVYRDNLDRMCSKCRTTIRLVDFGRKNFWNRLPIALDLGSWEALDERGKTGKGFCLPF